VRAHIAAYLSDLKATIDRIPADDVEAAVKLVDRTRRARCVVYIAGNGGSAATASHFVNELTKSVENPGLPRVRAYALTDNIPLFSAYANDQGYEHSFSEQIAGIIGAGDLLIAISASGQSPNILRAVDTARSAGAATIGITGFDGGRLKDMVDVCILVPSHNIRQVEDVHMALVHLIGSCLVSMG